jgi:NRPS condensation-like uncharacterized protein
MLGSTGKYYFLDEISNSGGHLYARGVFLRPSATDEKHQSNFNLSSVNCEKTAEWGIKRLVNPEITCDVLRSYVLPAGNHENTCYLDFVTESFKMKEIDNNIIIGVPLINSGCHQETLTINRSTKQVSISYTRLNSKDCTASDHVLDAFAEILQECPKDRQH